MELNPVKAVRKFYEDSVHVFSISYKPTPDVFRKTLKIVLFGALLIGVLGFVVSYIVGLII
jgi:preprotein translocase subunit Sss1